MNWLDIAIPSQAEVSVVPYKCPVTDIMLLFLMVWIQCHYHSRKIGLNILAYMWDHRHLAPHLIWKGLYFYDTMGG